MLLITFKREVSVFRTGQAYTTIFVASDYKLIRKEGGRTLPNSVEYYFFCLVLQSHYLCVVGQSAAVLLLRAPLCHKRQALRQPFVYRFTLRLASA